MTEHDFPISQQTYDGYVQNGFQPGDIPRLEAVVSAINSAKKGTIENIIAIGASLSEVREQFPYGSWGFFVQYRCGLSADTAERAIASYRLVQRYPALLSGNMQIGALYRLSTSKQLSSAEEAIISDVVETANYGEVTPEEVGEIIKKHSPVVGKAPQKPQRLGFNPVDGERAAKAREYLTNTSTTLFQRLSLSGLNPKVTLANREFKAFTKRIATNSPNSEFESAITSLLISAFVMTIEKTTEEDTGTE